MSLDIHSPKGQKSLEYERRAVQIFKAHFPDFEYNHTDKDSTAVVDAVMTHNGKITNIVEQKSRNMTLDQLISWNNEWLVTFDKIDAGRELAKALGTHYYGFLYLIPDDLLLVQHISNRSGEWVSNYRTEYTTTQKSINGGAVERLNAFIDMSEALVYRD